MAMQLVQHTTTLRRATEIGADGTAYAVTWLAVEQDDEDGGRAKRMMLPAMLMRYTGGAVRLVDGGAAEAFALPAATVGKPDGVGVDLSRTPPPTSSDDVLMDVTTVKRLLDGARPDVPRLFADLTAAFRRFVAFPARDRVEEADYATLCAAYVLSTYLLPSFSAVGYLWLTGLPGSGKSTVAHVIARTACLPLMASSSGTLASLRGHADAGGTLILDNYESVNGKDDVARNLRSFCELGYQRGAVVTLQVPSSTGRGWETQRANVYCNRAFTAVAAPPDALASRCITILMFRTDDQNKASLSPQDDDNWQVTPHDITQRCWMFGLHHLSGAAKMVRTITSENTGLTNRDLQVWRPVLTVARLVDTANGETAVWDALLRLVRHLHDQRDDDDDSREAALTRALVAIAEDGHRTTNTATVLAMVRRQYAGAHGITGDDNEDTPWGLENVKKIGMTLKRMGLPKQHKSAGNVYDLAPPTLERLRTLYLPRLATVANNSSHHSDHSDASSSAPPIEDDREGCEQSDDRDELKRNSGD